MKISIVTTVRNRADTVGNAMASVARQRLSASVELEYIVVDGGSTDGTVDIIREFDDGVKGNGGKGDGSDAFSFRWISEPDRGLYDGINKGIQLATGDVIGICHADDVLAEDDTIVKVADAFSAENGEGNFGGADAIYADIRFVNSLTSDLNLLRSAPTTRYCTGRYFRNWMFRFATFPAHPSTFIRRECFEKFGFYSLDYSICADFELMLRLFYKKKIRARYLPVCTHVMRMGGMSTKNLKANVRINKEDLRALKANGVWSCLPLIYLKYFAKIWGFVFKSRKGF